MGQKKLFLLDAFALIFRAYYALIRSPRRTRDGKNTNAQFGFTSTLFDLMQKEQPTHMAVVFDTHAPTERHSDYSDYKANRQEAPEDLLQSIPDIKRIIQGFRVPCLEADGYEADDLIGGLARQAAEKGYTVYMVTPDKDYGQLVSDQIFIYKRGYQGGQVEILGVPEVCQRWNIERVDQVVDMLGLMGDSVDNIPGIPGIGEKTAAKLLKEYDNLENLLAQADKIKGALGEKIRQGADLARLSKKLATIITETPIPFHEEDFQLREPDREALSSVFSELEFKTLGRRILGEESPLVQDLFAQPGEDKGSAPAPSKAVSLFPDLDLSPRGIENIESRSPRYSSLTWEEIPQLVQKLGRLKSFAFDTETTGLDPKLARIIGMSFSWESGQGVYVPLPPDREAQAYLSLFQPLFDREDLLWIGQNIKYDLSLLKWHGFEIRGQIYDTMLAHYVVEPEGKRSMDDLAIKYLNYEPIPIEALIGKKGKGQGKMEEVPLEQITDYAAEDADVTFQLKQVLAPLVKENQVERVLHDLELPLVPILLEMEYEGVGLDVPFLRDYSRNLEKEIRETESRIYAHAGTQFNIGSPRQLGRILFDEMKIEGGGRKTKTGQYATGEDVLQKIRKAHPIIEDIQNYRELTKLKSTYVDALPELIHPLTGRLHTSFNQALVVTGRLSSHNPNLQNIPVRTDKGREIRKAFIPRDKDWTIVSADYSQIELRIIAAISGDQEMIGAFQENKDIHTATAAKVYQVSEDEVTAEMRRAAKAVNFGIIYGQSAFGLSESLGISRSDARQIIDTYFQQYPSIKAYMDSSIESAKTHGYVQTLYGRRRYLRDIHSANHTVRGFAERNAINMPIQGTAADMIKLAMIRVFQALKDQKLKTRMVLQVHDELVFDVPLNEVDRVCDLVREGMEKAMILPHEVPVRVETGMGANWLEAH